MIKKKYLSLILTSLFDATAVKCAIYLLVNRCICNKYSNYRYKQFYYATDWNKDAILRMKHFSIYSTRCMKQQHFFIRSDLFGFIEKVYTDDKNNLSNALLGFVFKRVKLYNF